MYFLATDVNGQLRVFVAQRSEGQSMDTRSHHQRKLAQITCEHLADTIGNDSGSPDRCAGSALHDAALQSEPFLCGC